MAFVFVTGASGFIGRPLCIELLRRGHKVRGLVRRGAEDRAAPGCEVAIADPLDASSYCKYVSGADVFVHLVGVSKPNPAKAEQFRRVDLPSAKAAVANAVAAAVQHFIYVSVAQPAPVMQEYIKMRAAAESAIRAAGLNATILRPWYVLGPGRHWPLLLLPAYWIMGAIPGTRSCATSRLGPGSRNDSGDGRCGRSSGARCPGAGSAGYPGR